MEARGELPILARWVVGMRTKLGIDLFDEDELDEPSEPSIELDWNEDPLGPKTLFKIREFLGVTQDEFAELVGSSLRAVKAWERHKRDHEARNCTGTARKFILHLVRERLHS